MNKNELLKDSDVMLITKNPPQQIDFVSLIQWFGTDKRFKIDLRDFQNGFRLAPYGQDIYGLLAWPNQSPFSEDGTLNIVFEGYLTDEDVPLAILKFNKEEYKLAKEKHAQYWTWKKNRNEARSELEEQFGYDTKHAMHLVRLLRMGKEALEEGVLKVKRPDAEELLAIRNGAWSYEQCVEYAEEMDELIRGKLYKETNLRKKPSMRLAAMILMDVQRLVWDE